MTLAQFKRTLNTTTAPRGCAPALAALWWARKGDWEKAHKLVMDDDGRDAAWVHAYLHRLEGDAGNADAAQALVRFITAPAAAAVIKKHGMEPS